MGNISANPAQHLNRVSQPQTAVAASQPVSVPQKGAALQQGDAVSISSIRSNILNLEAQITQFKLQEEQQLSGVLNQQLDTLESSASERRETLTKALKIISDQRLMLPGVVENHSIDHSFMRQIEGQESVVLDAQNRLEGYVADLRKRSNVLLARTNANTHAATPDMDIRINELRRMIGEISASPLTRDLLASRLK